MSYELKNYSISGIVAHMQQHCPIRSKCNNSTSYAEIATKYIDITVNAILESDVGPGDDQYYVWKSQLADQLINKYNGNNRWYTWLHENYPLFSTITNSNKGFSTASLIKSYVSEQELLEYLYHNRQRVIGRLEIPRKNIVETPIDCESLSNYIDNQIYYRLKATDSEQKDRYRRNISRACQILSRAELNNGILPQSRSETDWPRQFLSGINLQNNTKSSVRDAALGRCYKYDINSSAFAFKATVIQQWAQAQGIEYKPSAMMQLLSDKRGIRTMLAYDVFKATNTNQEHKLELIKEAITAMGFGASVESPLGAIQNIIWNSDDYERFVNHEWVQEFQTEQKLFSEIIRQTYDRKWVKANMQSALKGTRYSQSKLEAYLYAQFETKLMTAIQKSVGEDNILLWVHDCVYTRTRIDLDYFNRVPEQMGYPMIQFSCERVDPIKYNKLAQLEVQLETHSHSDRIAHEEYSARNYHSNWIDTATAEIFANRVNIPIANVEIECAWEEFNLERMRLLNE